MTSRVCSVLILDSKAPVLEYRLKAIINHTGSANFGHFYSLIQIEGKWYCFSDTHVSEWSIDLVFRYAKGIGDSSASAYCLFYSAGTAANQPNNRRTGGAEARAFESVTNKSQIHKKAICQNRGPQSLHSAEQRRSSSQYRPDNLHEPKFS